MKRFLLLLIATAGIPMAHAAISVGPTGSGTLTFDTTPAATEFSTGVLNGSGTTYATATDLDTGANTLDATSIVRTLPTSTTIPPSTFSGGFRHNNSPSGLWIQSRPTTDSTNAANVLLATLQNDSGDAISSITISYTFGINNPSTEEAPGFRVFYSLSGAAGTWQLIPELSGTDVPGTHSTTVSVGSWPAAGTLYLLWVDDNAGGTDPSYTIDDFSVTPGNVILPLSVVLISPTNGTLFAAPAGVIVRANSSGTTPATSISFYTNNVLFATDDAAPYSNQLVNLPAGTYSIYAVAANGIETVYSQTNTITVRPEFVSYNGGTYVESFDSLTEAGTTTPVGWYVGGALPATTLQVTPSDGSAGASGTVFGWNYGSVGDTDRALGTAPTGADRNIVLRILNNTSSNMTGINLIFDGEVWRNYTNLNGSLTNYISVDQGATWVPTTFDFAQPFEPAQPQGAVNGNDPANRIANLGGGFDLPSPVVPGGSLYIRWQDFNETGTDGGLAIDNVQFEGYFEQFTPFVSITSVTNGQTFAEAAPITITAVAALANPVTNVTFLRDGGIVIGSDPTAPFTAVYSNSTAGVHTLTATAQDSLGNSVSTTNVITIVIEPNQLPSIVVTNPADSSFVVGANITNGVVVTDPDGSIAAVEYYVDGVLVYRDLTNPTKFEYGDALAGAHTVTAVAIDNAGGRASNSVSFTVTAPAGSTFLVTNGSSWSYLDDTTDPGATWNQLAFNDSGWSNGLAEFGFGDSAQDRPERTVVRRSVGTVTNITYYFRRTFTVADLGSINNLVLQLQADDGAIVYLNGTEVYRTTNMPAGPATHTTFTTDTAPDDGAGYTSVSLPSSVLVAGANIVAVEIHQDSLGSSDISFDLMLSNQAAAGPTLRISRISDTQAEISWPDSFTGYRLEYKTDLNQASWLSEPAVPVASGGFYRVTVDTSTGMKFWRLVSP